MYIIFDTNIYRGFTAQRSSEESKRKILAIKQLQDTKGVIALMSTTVASELIAHVLDNGAFNPEGNCTKAIRTLYMHCGDINSYGMIPTPEVQISKDYFNKTDESGIETQKSIAQICYAISKDPTENTVNRFKEQIESIRKHNNDVEDSMKDLHNFLAKVWKEDKRSEYDKIALMKKITAVAFLTEIAKKNGIRVPETGDFESFSNFFDKEVSLYLKQYAAPLQMMTNFCKKLSNTNFDVEKPERINQVWDQRILHVSGQSINNSPIIIVSSDKEMRKAAEETKIDNVSNPFNSNVISMDEYLSWLNK